MAKKRFDVAVPQKRISSILTLLRQNDIIAMLLDGRDTSKEIVPYLMRKYNLTHGTCNFYIKEARSIIKNRRKFEVNNLVSLHIHRYEELYKLLNDIGADNIAMKALAQKEKLMGFHREGFHMKVTQGEVTSVQMQTIDSDYNVKSLSKEKQNQLTVLLNKAKRDGSGHNKVLQVRGKGDQEA
jgi:hypothetical protein